MYGASFSSSGASGGGTASAAGAGGASAVASQPLFHDAMPATSPQMSSQICEGGGGAVR